MGQGRAREGKWDDSLVPPDLYFSREYHEVSARLEGSFEKLVLLEWRDSGGEIYLPLLLRAIPGEGLYDATNAYAHAGPWTIGQPDPLEFSKFFHAWSLDNKVVATFLQFHPLYDYASQFSEAFPLQKTCQTVMWNLATENLVAQMSSSHRRNWRRAVSAGLETKVIPSPADLTEFRELYEMSMKRLNVRPFYFFPDAYWEGLQQQLGDQLVQVDALLEGRTVASVLCFATGDCLHFHLNGATDEGRALRGPFVAHLAAAQWGQQQGYTCGNLGVTSEGSLLDFKNKFDPATPHRDFFVTHIVHDEANFQRLSEGLPASRYFPPWRDPEIESANLVG